MSDNRRGGLPGTELKPDLIKPNKGVELALLAVKTDKGYQVFPVVDGIMALQNPDNAPVIPGNIAGNNAAGFIGAHAGLYVTWDRLGILPPGAYILNDQLSLFWSR